MGRGRGEVGRVGILGKRWVLKDRKGVFNGSVPPILQPIVSFSSNTGMSLVSAINSFQNSISFG